MWDEDKILEKVAILCKNFQKEAYENKEEDRLPEQLNAAYAFSSMCVAVATFASYGFISTETYEIFEERFEDAWDGVNEFLEENDWD